jgi:hypothetical protein
MNPGIVFVANGVPAYPAGIMFTPPSKLMLPLAPLVAPLPVPLVVPLAEPLPAPAPLVPSVPAPLLGLPLALEPDCIPATLVLPDPP